MDIGGFDDLGVALMDVRGLSVLSKATILSRCRTQLMRLRPMKLCSYTDAWNISG